MTTPPHSFPTISENLTVRIKLATLVTLIAAIVGGAVWMTTITTSVNALDHRLERIEAALGVGTWHGAQP